MIPPHGTHTIVAITPFGQSHVAARLLSRDVLTFITRGGPSRVQSSFYDPFIKLCFSQSVL